MKVTVHQITFPPLLDRLVKSSKVVNFLGWVGGLCSNFYSTLSAQPNPELDFFDPENLQI